MRHLIVVGQTDRYEFFFFFSEPSPKQGLPNFDTSARFSAWRWTRVVLEMRVEFKALTMRIAEGQNVAEAKQTLNQLVHATLDRETTADDTDLLCEVFRGVDSMVTQEVSPCPVKRRKKKEQGGKGRY